MKLLINESRRRSLALVNKSIVLLFSSSDTTHSSDQLLETNSLPDTPQCSVELKDTSVVDLSDYIALSVRPCHGCLGLISVGRDIFICVINSTREVATVRPGETVSRIYGVEFYCLSSSDYDHLESDINSYPVEADGWDQGRSQQPIGVEHPCLALRKLLSDGTFYFSAEFDLTNRLQDRSISIHHFDVTAFDPSFMWNSHMIDPLLQFRSRLSQRERYMLDDSKILTCVIRGFVESLTTPKPISRAEGRSRSVGLPAYLTLISRLSCRRAGTRFNSRGIDDDGNVANFVETETVLWNPISKSGEEAIGFSYCQVRGSIPIFWEQQTGLLPNQQKIQITRSPEATQPAFDKHMDVLVRKYGATHIINLLSESKSGEVELSTRYRLHTRLSPFSEDVRRSHEHIRPTATLLKTTEYDFHAETKGPGGYEAASMIRHLIEDSADSFGYFLMEETSADDGQSRTSPMMIVQQEGVFRTNCLDCLDRTNLVQGILSRMSIESFLDHRGESVGHDFWMRHSTLWADNGDALSKIYAGTGALKSSFTRTGKMSLAGAIADARKSATRIYINNFADKDRQNTIDVLLGRLVGQSPVKLFDPVNDYVIAEMNKRAADFITERSVTIYAGTFNLNGQTSGINEDLSPWLKPTFLDDFHHHRDIVVVGFQEIVELSPQQIMSTDPARRQLWERAVLRCLNCEEPDPYVMLRSGQLVGAALMVFVRSSAIGYVKNVEGSLKKTGMSGMAGNKGAVAVRFEYASTRLCFVTAHLAAGFSNSEERNRDYSTIVNGLRFQRDRRIENHDTIIWLGDFNYRIGLSDDKVRKLVEIGDLKTLHDNDQLHLHMVAGLTFPYYQEAKITFDPTYKFNIGTDDYDTSEKSRIPAWCDRILWKGRNLHQLCYGSAPLRFSDHRPVYGIFNCNVAVVDESAKEALENRLYMERQGRKGSSGARAQLIETDEDDDDLVDIEPLKPDLPPPSSDTLKWWLRDGFPVKSTTSPPSANSTLNPERLANPFVDTSIPDWIVVKSQHSTIPALPLSIRTQSVNTVQRKLPPPYDPSSLPLMESNSSGAIPRKPVGPHQPAPAPSMSGQLRKPAPPRVPRKPVEFTQKPQPVSALAHRTSPPPQVRETSTPSPNKLVKAPPSLPPRTDSGKDLMDREEALAKLSWEPLKPS